MLADGGSTPPGSTKCKTFPDPRKGFQTPPSLTFRDTSECSSLVSVGLSGAPKRHPNDTTAPQSIAASATRSANEAHVSSPLSVTSGLGTTDCHLFRKDFFSRYPAIAWDVARQYIRLSEHSNHIQANRALLTLDKSLNIHGLNLSWNDDQLKSFAKQRADDCKQYGKSSLSDTHALAESLRLLSYFDIPAPQGETEKSQYLRLCDSLWWLRQIRRKKSTTLENTARNIGMIKKSLGGYCSTIGLRERRQQKQRNQQLLETTHIQDGEGNTLSLAEVAKHTISNPEIRRAELMTRIRGFEEVAALYGDCAEFYTITCPSRLHAYHSKSGHRNKKFDNSTIKEANDYLCHQWKLIRSALHRNNIIPYGFRVVEPHQDGTPHWHLLLFVEPEKRIQMREISRQYALAESPNEPGAQKHRFKAEAIDPTKGTAAGYIAKYIAKNVDGAHIEKDLYGLDAKNSAERIEAWASLNRIRQFQAIGGPSITTWRELRRLREEHSDPTIENARAAADSSDFAAFVIAMGGVHLRKKLRPIQPLYENQESVDQSTGEITPQTNHYGEASAPKLIGVLTSTISIKTRTISWHKIAQMKPLRGVGFAGGAAPPIPTPRSGLGLV